MPFVIDAPKLASAEQPGTLGKSLRCQMSSYGVRR